MPIAIVIHGGAGDIAAERAATAQAGCQEAAFYKQVAPPSMPLKPRYEPLKIILILTPGQVPCSPLPATSN
jgi:hypothetical protein